MKKLLLFAGVMFLFASLAMAQANFAPAVMEITCPEEISYDFGDESLNIPFSVTGVPGAFWLVINSHGKADGIVDVENGFLGWHYVNNIDTTVYVSGRYQRELGDVKVAWDGTSSMVKKLLKIHTPIIYGDMMIKTRRRRSVIGSSLVVGGASQVLI